MEKLDLQGKVGKRIRDIRSNKGISLQQLAASCDMEKSNLSRLESGNTNPTIYTLYRIAESLEIPLIELLKF